MAEEKTMVLNVVDLQCSKCYKKIKKILCRFPEIRDQKYDEKANKVTIKVVSCSPEKIRDKLCCMGGGCITSIEILPPPPPPTPPPTPPPPPPPPKEVKVSVDLQVHGFLYCIFCGSRPCSCDRRVPCDPPPPPPPRCKCKLCLDVQLHGFCCRKGCSGSCGGRGRCDPCYERPICDSWSGCGSGCGETQPDCSIM